MSAQQSQGSINLERQVYTIEEMCQILGMRKSTAYHLISKGHIPSIRLGSTIRVPIAAIERILATPAQ